MIRLLLLALIVFGTMLVEARRASANERLQRVRGGIEPRHDVYAAMQVVYPGVFLAMIGEGFFRSAPSTTALVSGVLVFMLGKSLKWWAITTLGSFWTFRVIVVPGTAPVTSGPYRFLHHPNYAGVLGELVGVAFIAGSPVAGALGTMLFATLMAVRVRVENRALGAILRRG